MSASGTVDIGIVWLSLVVVVVIGDCSLASHGSVVRWADLLVVVVISDSQTTSTDCTKLGVALQVRVVVLWLSLPKLAVAGARGIVVGWGRSEALLLAVVSDQGNLEQGGKEEKERADDGDSKRGGVESAGKAKLGEVGSSVTAAKAESVGAIARISRVGRTVTKRSDDIALAGRSAVSGEPCKRNEATDKGNVEDDGDECEEWNAAEEAGQDNGKDEVKHCGSADSLCCLLFV